MPKSHPQFEAGSALPLIVPTLCCFYPWSAWATGLPSALDLRLPVFVILSCFAIGLTALLYKTRNKKLLKAIVMVLMTSLALLFLSNIGSLEQTYLMLAYFVLGIALLVALVLSAKFKPKIKWLVNSVLLGWGAYALITHPGVTNVYGVDFSSESSKDSALVVAKKSIRASYEEKCFSYRVDSAITLDNDETLYGVFSGVHVGDRIGILRKQTDVWDIQLTKLKTAKAPRIRPLFKLLNKPLRTKQASLTYFGETIGWAHDFDSKPNHC